MINLVKIYQKFHQGKIKTKLKINTIKNSDFLVGIFLYFCGSLLKCVVVFVIASVA